ncbi:hypothetical protein [Microbacterium sp.]|uniref:hypothetical protein n=1 Tax=Microbacterium sp. TaxID=51671 RepID=UPI002733AF89|nr:hypothetical protein [Microbacterium sp.]MDP3949087.1 hypothetical protein [Microbacterium sp.]
MAERDDDDLSIEIATTDKYRARSKSVAALTAAAAGALAAGLALNPALVSFPFATRVFGMATVILLVLATGAFVVGSVLHARSTRGRAAGRAINRLIRPWEALFSSQGEWPTPDEYRSSIESVQRQIMRATDIGMWLATGAIVSVVAALISMLLLNEQREALEVKLADTSTAMLLCPSLPAVFEASARSVELQSTDGHLTFVVVGELCDPALAVQTVELSVARTDVVMIRPATK